TSPRRRPRSPFASASSTAWRTSLVRNPFVSPELCPSDAMASSCSIYATTSVSGTVGAVPLQATRPGSGFCGTGAGPLNQEMFTIVLKFVDRFVDVG
ncbi:MAG: hypothetical protein VB140_09175, partial [Burkholderia sp.]